MSPRFFYLVVFTGFIFVLLYVKHDQCLSYNVNPQNKIIDNRGDTFFKKIAIGIVVCYVKDKTGPRKEAEVLIKSAILSAQTYAIIKTIEIYIFVEHLTEDSQYFSKMLDDLGHPFQNLDVRLFVKSALNSVPEIYRKEITSGISFTKFRCAKLRLFFPSVLTHLDSILYLDTDIIITGNLVEVWKYFKLMNENQLIGIANDYEDHSPRKSDWVSKIPIPPPKGLNSGVLLMNLTKMRELNWEEKLMRIDNDYSKITDDLNDQQLINIFCYYNTQLFIRLPCHLNFRAPHCDTVSNCKSAVDIGVHVVHGAASHFSKNGALYQLFLTYQSFDFRTYSAIQLLTKIQEIYQFKNESRTNVSKNRKPSCTGVIDSLILKIVEKMPKN